MRVAIADDSGVFRESLVRSLREIGHEVVVEASDGEGFVAALRGVRADVVVLDVDMPPSGRAEGIKVARKLKRDRPRLPILLISAYTATPQAIELLQSFETGIGYLHKNHIATIEELTEAFVRLQAGESVVDSELVTRLMAAPDLEPDLGRLTPQEQHVLRLMAQGYSNSGIARAMDITGRTVEDYVTRVFTKLGLAERDAAAVPGGEGNKRVLAVLLYLRLTGPETLT